MSDLEMDARVECAMKAAAAARSPAEADELRRAHIRDIAWSSLGPVAKEVELACGCLQLNDDVGFEHHLCCRHRRHRRSTHISRHRR
jgi:hypothetical protein